MRKNDQNRPLPIKMVDPTTVLTTRQAVNVPGSSTQPEKTAKERVLVFDAKLLERLGEFSGIITDPVEVKRYADAILKEENLFYMDRAAAETNPAYKQLIPYCVLQLANKVFCYQRTKKGSENRLHDKWSVGVGGHINPSDGRGREAYEAAFARELAEEVSWMGNVRQEMKALLYDPSDEVGRVHFGIVHLIMLDKFYNTHGLKFYDPALDNYQFQFIMELKRNPIDKFEKWSQLVLQSNIVEVPQ